MPFARDGTGKLIDYSLQANGGVFSTKSVRPVKTPPTLYKRAFRTVTNVECVGLLWVVVRRALVAYFAWCVGLWRRLCAVSELLVLLHSGHDS